MTVTLAPLAPDIPHYGMYKHTDGTCMSPKDPAPPIRLRSRMRLNILWLSERPREQPRVSCRSVHMCESSGTLLPVQLAGGMCAVLGASAQYGFELKMSHLVVLCRLRWPSSQRHVVEMRCTWRKQSSRRGSRVGAREKKITFEIRAARGAASSRAATRSLSFDAAAAGPPSWLSKSSEVALPGGRGKLGVSLGSNVRSALASPQPSPDPPRPTLR